MTAEACCPKEIGKRWFEEVWNQRKASLVHEILAPGAKGHMEGAEVVGAGGFVEFHEAILSAMPDLRITVRDTIAEGPNVCVHWLAKATHTGNAFGLKPTGKSLDFHGMSWFRVEDGRIVEGWDCWNQDALFAKLSQS